MRLHWNPDLGAERCFVELAAEFRKLGHTVDKFDLDDAFPKNSLIQREFAAFLFTRAAEAHLKKCAGNYDVVMTTLGVILKSKRQLGFKGVLVSRSDGLTHFYVEQEKKALEEDRRKGVRRGSALGNTVRRLAARLHDQVATTELGFQQADFITLLNSAEFEFVRTTLGQGSKALLVPNGLSDARAAALEQSTPPAQRLQNFTVAFIGYWGIRKGHGDIPKIVRVLRTKLPALKFQLFGTIKSEAEVRLAFDAQDQDALEIVRKFESGQLPHLLARATAGMLPSLVEGFGIAAIEMLTAGIPVAAYDTHGPHDILSHFTQPLLAPIGDYRALAGALETVLTMPLEKYALLAGECQAIAKQYRWQKVARQLTEIWSNALGQMRG